jgi:predicted SnoaL-like aldol condensation-catalyzing enzyme
MVRSTSAGKKHRAIASEPVAVEAERHRRLVMDVYEKVLKPLDESRVDEFFRTDYIQHNPMARTGAQGLKAFLKWAKSVSPSAEHHVKRMFVDGNYVIAHVHVIVQPGDLGSAVVDIFRIEDGLIAEHWDVAQQLPRQSQNENGMF